jgi:hypothetical protein
MMDEKQPLLKNENQVEVEVEAGKKMLQNLPPQMPTAVLSHYFISSLLCRILFAFRA